MPLDIDYVAAKRGLDELDKVLRDQPHGERSEIAYEIIKFADKMKTKYNT